MGRPARSGHPESDGSMNVARDTLSLIHTVELGFLDFLSGLAQENGGYLLVKGPDPDQRIGASCVLRNHVGVEFTVDVEAIWEPEA
jgi:hypothetical protein